MSNMLSSPIPISGGNKIPTLNPSSDFSSEYTTGANEKNDDEISLGTTIMAISFNGGVILAADSRTSSGTYVVNRASNKITKLTSHIFCCRSGSAADTQYIAKLVSNLLEKNEVTTGFPSYTRSAANLMRLICLDNRWVISAGMIVAGYDVVEGGVVYSIPSGGCCLKQNYAIGGSGSIFLYSFFDANFKPSMTEEECLAFCRTAVSHAYARDGSSGGLIRTVIITKNGARGETLPWTAAPYAMERDLKYQKLISSDFMQRVEPQQDEEDLGNA